ncbi:TPA: LemA family protein [bacterium]|jgi:LemA protein|nr:LemA family protein [bacterium]
MEKWIIPGIIILVAIILIMLVVSTYNKLVKSRNRVSNSWSQIDVQLKRRFDLIPNLVETTKGYASHEKGIFEEFAKARNAYNSAAKISSVEGMAEANNMLSSTLSRLLAVSEAYPELKADKNFAEMMSNLKETEDKIAYARQFYNDVVLTYNNLREVFPSNIIANMFGFKESDYFKAAEVERENVKVEF